MINRQQLRQQTAVALYNARPYYLKQADSEWGESLLKAGKSFTDAMGPSFQPVVDFTRDVGDKMPFLRATPLNATPLPDASKLSWQPKDKYITPITGEQGIQTIKNPTQFKQIDSKGNKELQAALVAQGFKPISTGSNIYTGTLTPHVLSQGGQSTLKGVQAATPGWFKKMFTGKDTIRNRAAQNIETNIKKDIGNLDPLQRNVFGPQGYTKAWHKDAMNLYQQAQILKAAGKTKEAEAVMRQYKVVYDSYNQATKNMEEQYQPLRTMATGTLGGVSLLFLLYKLFGAR